MALNWKEIGVQIEQLKDSQSLRFKLHETFGAGIAIIELNSKYPAKKEKKYWLKWGKSEEIVRGLAEPFWATDKSKDLAKWVADRYGEPIQ
jgi:hypothetical protein